MPYFGGAGPINFLDGGNFMTKEDLLANYPASVNYLGIYARISNSWGGVSTVYVCETDGTGMYYWRPQREDYAVANTATSGGVTLTPLVSAPLQFFSGTLIGNMTLTPSSTNVWPGCTFRVAMTGILGIFGININGLVGGGVVPLLGGSTREIVYTGSAGWRAA